METKLIIEPFPEEAMMLLEKSFRLIKVTHLHELRIEMENPLLNAVLCPVRLYQPCIIEAICQAVKQPRLVLVRTRLDKMNIRENDAVGYWNNPYRLNSLKRLLDHPLQQSVDDLERIHVMENRKMKMIKVNEILLIQKLPPGQVIIYTTEGDYMINANLTNIISMLPENRLKRVSDQLMVPLQSISAISRKGYPFRGGYIPIKDRYLKTRIKRLSI